MIIKTKNNVLTALTEYLQKVTVRGKAIRGKQKLLQKMVEKYREFMQNIEEIKKEFENEEERNAQFGELLNEEVRIDMTEYPSHVKALFENMDDYPHEVGKKDEVVHSLLTDVLEEAINNKNGDDE